MTIILSPSAEKTTNDVIAWLCYIKKTFIRITEETNPGLRAGFGKHAPTHIINGIDTNSISAFWSRKGYFTYSVNTNNDDELNRQLQSYLQFELQIVSDYLISELEKKRHLGNYFERFPNKLIHLSLAQQAGLTIPKTLLTQSRKTLLAFQKETGPLITKSIKDSFTSMHESVYYYNHTECITEEALADMPDTFFPTLVQEQLIKKYELRVVFVRKKLYSMAIFSQFDKQTCVDWRNYNHQSPNRTVPYQLPNPVAGSILRFIQASRLNTGAIDMVVTSSGEHVFLECNPNGQISMVSGHCNYAIEKDIATYLAYGIDPGT